MRSQLEQHALGIDQRLIAAASLPKGRREAAIDEVAPAVDQVEATVADVVLLRGPTTDETGAAIDAIQTRLRFLTEANEELAALDGSTPDLSALRDQLEAASSAEPPEDGQPQSEPPPAP